MRELILNDVVVQLLGTDNSDYNLGMITPTVWDIPNYRRITRNSSMRQARWV